MVHSRSSSLGVACWVLELYRGDWIYGWYSKPLLFLLPKSVVRSSDLGCQQLCGALGPGSNNSGVEYQSTLATFWGSWCFLIGSVAQWYESLEKYPVEETNDDNSDSSQGKSYS
jgi:hypothetical protein